MTEFQDNMPKAEQLTKTERLANYGRQLLRAVARNSENFTGTPDAYQQVSRGVNEVEYFANYDDSELDDAEPITNHDES